MTDSHGWRGVFFDLDGTLADTVPLILLSYRHTMRTHLGEASPDDLWLATIGTPLREQLGAFARTPAELEGMVETYTTFQRRVHDEMVRPFPRAAEVLTALRSRGSRLAIVTSKRSDVARRTLDVCGLAGLVDLLVCAEDVQRGKPHPEGVQRALTGLGLDDAPREVLFVGDSVFDLRAGRAAGTRTAAVPWGAQPLSVLAAEGSDYVVESLLDLLEIGPAAEARPSRLAT